MNAKEVETPRRKTQAELLAELNRIKVELYGESVAGLLNQTPKERRIRMIQKLMVTEQ